MKPSKINFYFLIPFIYSSGFFFQNGIKTITYIVLVIYLFILSNFFSNKFRLKLDYIEISYLSIFLFTALSYLWSENKEEFYRQILSKIPFTVVPIIFISKNSNLLKIKKGILYGFFLNGLFISILCVLNTIFFSSLANTYEEFVYENLSKFSGLQPIYLSLYLIISSWSWYYLFSENFLPKSWIIYVFPIFFYLMIVFLSSRTEFIVYTICLILILIRHFYQRKVVLFTLAGSFLILTFSLIMFSKTNATRFKEMFDFGNNLHNNQWGGRALRIEKWKSAIDCYFKFPILGTGAGDAIDELLKTYLDNGLAIAYERKFNPHNQYLQTLLTLGPVGLILLLSIFGICFLRSYLNKDFSLFLLGIIFGVSMLTESMLERQTGIFLFCVLLPYFVTISPLENEISTSGNGRIKKDSLVKS
jgi:O-antigen ligase